MKLSRIIKPAPLIASLLALLFAMAANALAAPPTEMERLAAFQGLYRIEGVRHEPEGPVPLTPSEGRAEFILNGMMLQETAQVDMGDAMVTLQTYFSFDSYRQVYRIAAMDDTFGLMDIYEGRFTADGVLVATNLRADTYFPLEGGQRLHFQLRYDFSKDVKTFDVLMTTDGGATWSPYFEMTYTPVGG